MIKWTELPAVQSTWKLMIGLILIALLIWLVKSAQNSLKRTGGKWTSVIDEIIVGIIGIVIFFIIVDIPLNVLFAFIEKIVIWIGNMVLEVLRVVGVPV